MEEEVSLPRSTASTLPGRAPNIHTVAFLSSQLSAFQDRSPSPAYGLSRPLSKPWYLLRPPYIARPAARSPLSSSAHHSLDSPPLLPTSRFRCLLPRQAAGLPTLRPTNHRRTPYRHPEPFPKTSQCSSIRVFDQSPRAPALSLPLSRT